ncbi:XdhC family protein [Adhaeribacter aquaticus]|uniref:XdhC family protein n=1 Tax=Adhaeribacter aquaticus TaxID=299567 RepID=UPI0003FF35E8|nr:XdhC/CoxI family protein [Adhaeribacter aquaticus]
MNRQLEIWRLVSKSLAKDVPVMLLYVLESTGSSPGRQGFCMAVNALGQMQGSIGGGIMEHKFVEMAKDKLKYAKDEILVRKQVHNKTAPKDQSGMICSGEQTILLYQVKPQDLNTIHHIINCLELEENGLFRLSPIGLSFSQKELPAKDFTYNFTSETEWLYEEKLGYKNRLYLIGSGHCAMAFTKLMSSMDFYIHLFDDRPELNTFQKNTFAQKKIIVKSYEDLADLISSGENHYVVIMTFGYRTDDLAFRALIHKQFKYLGLLGSQNKIRKMFADYQEEGIPAEKLSQVYAPIGLPINSQTPEEIAISIAAQIIQVKNQHLKEQPINLTANHF